MSSISLRFTTSDETLQRLAQRYWSQESNYRWTETVRSIAAELEMSEAQLLTRVQSSCEVTLPGRRCNGCQSAQTVRSRVQFDAVGRKSRQVPFWCASCRRQADQRAADEKSRHAEQERQRIERTTRTAEGLLWSAQGEWAIDRLSVEEKVFLTAVIEASGSDHYNQLGTLSSFYTRLADQETTEQLISYLHQKRSLAVHPSSASLDLHDERLVFDTWRVIWVVPRTQERSTLGSLAKDLFAMMESTDVRNSGMLMSLYRKDSTERCFRFLRDTARKNLEIELPRTDRLAKAIQSVLSIYSLEKTFCIMYVALKDADWKRVSDPGAMDVRLVDSIRSTLEKANIGAMKLTPFTNLTPREALFRTLAPFARLI